MKLDKVFVLFADLLGFTNALEEEEPEYSESILEAAQEKLDEDHAFKDHKHLTRCGLSDSIFVVYEDADSALEGMSKIFRTFCISLLLLRGGAALGRVETRRALMHPGWDMWKMYEEFGKPKKQERPQRTVHEGNIIGQAVAVAVGLEKKLKGPRICVNQRTADAFRKTDLGKLLVVPTEHFEVWEVLWPMISQVDGKPRGGDLAMWHQRALWALQSAHGQFVWPKGLEEDMLKAIVESAIEQAKESLARRTATDEQKKVYLEDSTKSIKALARQHLGAMRRARSDQARDHVRAFYELVIRSIDRVRTSGDPSALLDDKGNSMTKASFWDESKHALAECTGLPDVYRHGIDSMIQRICASS